MKTSLKAKPPRDIAEIAADIKKHMTAGRSALAALSRCEDEWNEARTLVRRAKRELNLAAQGKGVR